MSVFKLSIYRKSGLVIDDDTTDPGRGSVINGMTLKVARENFQKVGVISDGYLNYVEPDKMQKFHSGKANPESLGKVPSVDIYELADNIVDKQGFVQFLDVLRDDYSANRGYWDNDNLASYLEGAYGYCYGDIKDEQLSWSMVATICFQRECTNDWMNANPHPAGYYCSYITWKDLELKKSAMLITLFMPGGIPDNRKFPVFVNWHFRREGTGLYSVPK